MKGFVNYCIIVVLVLEILLLNGCDTQINTVFRKVGIDAEKITEIILRYESDEDSTSLVIKKESPLYGQLIEYLNCSIEKVEDLPDIYTVDKLTAIIQENQTEVKLQFITTEGQNQSDSTVYLILEGSYYKMQNTETELVKHPITHTKRRDPLCDFLSYYIQRAEKEELTIENQENKWLVPFIDTEDYEMQSLDEIIRTADDIFIARIENQQFYGDAAACRLWTKEWAIRHSFHLSMPSSVFTDLEVSVKKVYYGDVEQKDICAFRIPYGRRPKKQRQRNIYSLGISEKEIKTGKEYLFFMKHLDCEEDNPLWVADFYFGVMEVSEDGMLVPLFNVDPELIGDYHISIEQLQQKIADIKNRLS